jgi:hypothetical protein
MRNHEKPQVPPMSEHLADLSLILQQVHKG